MQTGKIYTNFIRLVEAAAESDALEDLMDVLDKLLQKKKISLDVYQKNTLHYLLNNLTLQKHILKWE